MANSSDFLRLMRGDPRATDEEILSVPEYEDPYNKTEFPLSNSPGVLAELPQSNLEIPEEDVTLAPSGPTSKAIQPLVKEAAAISKTRTPSSISPKSKEIPTTQPSQIPQQTIQDVYGGDLNDEALKAAQEQQKNMQMFINMGRAADTILQGAPGVKLSDELNVGLEKQAGQPLKDILTRREAKDSELKRKKMLNDLADEDVMRNPNSDISKALRIGLKSVMPGLNIPEGVSGQLLRDSGYNLGTLISAHITGESRKEAAKERAQTREENLALRKETISDKKEQKQKDEMTKGLDKYEKKLRDIGLPSAVTLLSDIDTLTDTSDLPGVGTLSGALPSFMVGDKGRDLRQKAGEMRGALLKLRSGGAVTPQEFKRFDEIYAAPGFLNTEDGFRRGVEIYRDIIGQVSKNVEAGTNKEVKERFEEQGGVSSKEISSGNKYSPKTQPTREPQSTKEDPKISAFAKQNNLNYTKAERILRTRGYGK